MAGLTYRASPTFRDSYNYQGDGGSLATGITLVQSAHANSSTAASVIIPLTTVTTATDTLLAAFCLPVGASVEKVTDNIHGRWIQASYASSPIGGNVELWKSRGIQGGSASVTVIFSAASVDAQISEWSGMWFQSPLDTWSQNFGTGASITPQTVYPRTTGELVITVANSSASISGPTGGFTKLAIPGNNSGVGYSILSGSVVPTTYFNTTASASWAVLEAAFLPANSTTPGATTGPVGLNPLLQFPETKVQICEAQNYLSPIEGIGIWTDISSYVESMTLGPIGRQHELDRVQSSAAQFVMNGRDGTFNPWNNESFIYPGGLDPMTPIKVTASYQGVTSPIYYGYAQSFTPNIIDAQNSTVTIAAYDILQMLSLSYLSNDNYAQLVVADGGENLQAFYRLGDMSGSQSVLDSSGNGVTGSLVPGTSGTPAFTYAGPFLYDSSTSCDMTNGSNALNGGFSTTDNTTQPPTRYQPLNGASEWTYEAWIKWTSNNGSTPGEAVTFTGAVPGTAPYVIGEVSTLLGLSVGDGITGTGINPGTTITYVGNAQGFGNQVSLSQAASVGQGTFTATGGAIGSTIFSSASVPTLAPFGTSADIRVGAMTSDGVTSFNRVTVGLYAANSSYTIEGFTNGSTNVMDGNWHHVVVPCSGSVIAIYVDGALEELAALSPSWASPANITIGCDAGAVNGWVGAMANVALYSSILTAEQVASHYETGIWFQAQEYGASVGTTAAGRFNKLMSVEGLNSAAMLTVPYPFKTLLYSETNPVTTTSGLNYLQTMSETEPGLVFQAPNGQINAYSRQYQYLNPSSTTSNGIFGDGSAASVGFHFDGPSFQLVQDDLDTWNNIQVQSGRSGSQLQQAGPATYPLAAQSASVNGSRTLQGLTSLQFENDSDALAVAQNYLQWYATPQKRVTTLMTDSYGNSGANIPQILERGLYDRLTIQYQGQTPGPQFSQDSLIESISHTINIANGPIWTVQWQMSPYEILLAPFIFGASVGSASNQLAGAASVTGSGTSWVLHNPPVNDFYSGTMTFTVASDTTTVAYNATAAQVQAALTALVPSTTCSGGPLNTSNINISFGSSQSSFSAYFSPSQVLTL